MSLPLTYSKVSQALQSWIRPIQGTVVLSIIVGAVVVVSLSLMGGRVVGALAIGVVCAFGIIIAVRPWFGYYLLLFITIFADHHLWQFSTWTHRVGFYVFENWWKLLSPGTGRWFGFAVINTIEALFMAIAVGITIQKVRQRAWPIAPCASFFTMLYLGTLFVMLFFGLETGGALKPALWQSRYLFHFLVVAVLTPQILKTRGQIRTAVWVIMVAIVWKALQIDWIFFIGEGARFGDWREILGHEDSIFLITAITLGITLTLYGTGEGQRWFLVISLPFVLIALVLNLRRASYVALALSLGLIPILLYGRRRTALKVMLPALAILAFYCAIYWNRPVDTIGIPVHKLKSIFLAVAGTTDYSSNLYRLGENYNLLQTIMGHPFGLGFGHPFEIHSPLADISFLLPLWQYHPHNTILGMWMSLGSLGFIVFLVYFASLIMHASHNLRLHTDYYLKAISYLVLTAFMSGLLVGTVDQYWNMQRGGIFLGALAGILSVLNRLGSEGAPSLHD